MAEQEKEEQILREVSLDDDKQTNVDYATVRPELAELPPEDNFFSESKPFVIKLEYDDENESIDTIIVGKTVTEYLEEIFDDAFEDDKEDNVTEDMDEKARKKSLKQKTTLVFDEKWESIPQRLLSDASSKRADSYFSKKRISMEYDFVPRLGVDEMMIKMSGDYDTEILFFFEDMDMWSKVICHEEPLEEEEDKQYLDDSRGVSISTVRSLHCKKHNDIKMQVTINRIQNTILQRKLAIYLKKKRMEYALQDDENTFEMGKYNERLDEYDATLKQNTFRRHLINTQIDFLKQAKEQKSKQLEILFQNLQNREKDVGTGLVYSKTATELPEKLIQHLMNRQKSTLKELSSLRLKHIMLKIMVADIEEEILSIDEIDETYQLNYYEKLNAENLSYLDKIEEREAELTKLRMRCTECIQILAHLREKTSAFASDISDLNDYLINLKMTIFATRSQLNAEKKERDNYRTRLLKLKEESGLLNEPELLKDMEHSMKESKTLKKQLRELKKECNFKAKNIRCIRKSIEMEAVARTGKNVVASAKQRPSNFRKQHLQSIPVKGQLIPLDPITPNGALDYLIQDFQPTVMRINVN